MKNLSLIIILNLALGLITGCGEDVKFSQATIAAKTQPGASDVADPNPDPDRPDTQAPNNPDEPQEPQPIRPITPEPNVAFQEFTQVSASRKLDIVFVVDNSDSMAQDHYKRKLKSLFRGFVGSLQGVDFRLAVTTTSLNDTQYRDRLPQPGWQGSLDFIRGTRRRYLSSTDSNIEERLLATLDRPESVVCRRDNRTRDGRVCTSIWEQPLRAMSLMLDRRGEYDVASFMRSDADLAVIIVSDQDETAQHSSSTMNPEELKFKFDHTFAGAKNYTFYGVVIEPGDSSCLNTQKWEAGFIPEGADYGVRISRMVALTGGITTSICKSNVTQDLAVIGSSARAGALFDEVTLAKQPKEGSVNVELVPSTQIEYSVLGSKIKFSRKPPVGTLIRVSYEH